MSEDLQRWYWLERARASRELADKARDPAIARIHIELYERYLARAAETLEQVHVPRMVTR